MTMSHEPWGISNPSNISSVKESNQGTYINEHGEQCNRTRVHPDSYYKDPVPNIVETVGTHSYKTNFFAQQSYHQQNISGLKDTSPRVIMTESTSYNWNDVSKGDEWLITFYDGPYDAPIDYDIVKIKIKTITARVIGYKFHWWQRIRWCRKDRVSLIERYKAAT